MRGAVVKDGIVVNIVEVDDPEWEPSDGSLVISDTARKGDSYNGKKIVPAPLPEPIQNPAMSDEERIDEVFPQTDTARVLFEALFELSNRILKLEGRAEISRAQLKAWLKNKLP